MAESNVSPSEVAALTQRVTGVEQAVDSIRKDIHQLVTKFDDRSRFPWGTVIAGAGFIWTVMIAFVSVIAWGLLSQSSNIVEALNEHKVTYQANRALDRQDRDARFAQVEGQLSQSVPRGEHERVWQADAQRFSDVQRQIDEVKENLSGLYGARDFFQDVQDRLDRLERKTIATP